MKSPWKLMSTVIAVAALAACGGGDSSDGGNGGNNGGSGGDTGASGGNGSNPTSFVYHSRDYNGTRETLLDPKAASGTLVLGGDTFTYTYATATQTFTAADGYRLIGGLEGKPGIQVCEADVSAHVVLPANAVPATIDDLKGKELTWYEDCTVSDGTGPAPLPSSVRFGSDGSLSVLTDGQADTVDAMQVSELLSDAGFTDGSGTTRLHAYRAGEQIIVVFHQVTQKIIASWVYAP